MPNRLDEQLDQDDVFSLMNALESENQHSQRSIAKRVGFSLGKTNFLLKALVEKGVIKMDRFVSSERKAQYRYVFTPSGIKQRIAVTKNFLQRKETEYELLEREIKKAKEVLGPE